eukprot:gnl/Spiro4/266_TR165_c0_g1_i1.p1 gnl/Spiro4/266_TR165_c0_g1~~gnl/Spiro4/266_TR165_c0_g1_i1.p1  ORF type:complete len:463 (-),score=35.03 gnl/Spiro4/266_TR165_c0_g1_i1:15-1403(-)
MALEFEEEFSPDSDQLRLLNSPSKGRCVVARIAIPAGSTIHTESPLFWVPSCDSALTACNSCFAALPDNCPRQKCNSCSQAVWCSQLCRDRDRRLHQLECKMLLECAGRDGPELSENTRLVVRALALRHVEITDSLFTPVRTGQPPPCSDSGASGDGNGGSLAPGVETPQAPSPLLRPAICGGSEAPRRVRRRRSAAPSSGSIDSVSSTQQPADHSSESFQRFLALVDHSAELAGTRLDENLAVASFICGALGREVCPFTPQQVVELTSRIDSNCMSISAFVHGARHTARGVFRLASLFNHSCAPNCCYVFRGTAVHMTTICPIAQGEELCICYLAFNRATTAERRLKLRNAYFFECHCLRCELSSAHDASRTLQLQCECLNGTQETAPGEGGVCVGCRDAQTHHSIFVSCAMSDPPAQGLARHALSLLLADSHRLPLYTRHQLEHTLHMHSELICPCSSPL